MLRRLKQWQRARIIRRYPVSNELWEAVTGPMTLLTGLSRAERQRLREWTTLFLHHKVFFGARDFLLSEEMKVQIAVQACLLILHLDFDFYRGWRSVVVYPDSFLVPREETDEAGIVHTGRDILTGESWEAGPVVISWADGAPGAHPYGADTNVVIHEFAHKLDMLNGLTNGVPPLHPGMAPAVWTRAFAAAYQEIGARAERGQDTVLDPYAAEDPSEFFAVASECFFEAPWLLQREFPAVYGQLVCFYRQDPAAKARGLGWSERGRRLTASPPVVIF